MSTPLHNESSKGHYHVALLLVEHSANAAAPSTHQIQQSTTV